jgi:hypothetical protein
MAAVGGACRARSGLLTMGTELLSATTPEGLTGVEAQIAYLMVYGLPRPLTLEEAAKAEGYRLKRARAILDHKPEFQAYRQKLLDGRRKSEQAAIWQRRSRSETTPAKTSRPIGRCD